MKIAFIVSGLLGLVVWPFVILAGIMVLDEPNVPLRTEILRQVAVFSVLLPLPVWVAALVLAIFESKKKKRQRLLRGYAIAPYAAVGIHGLALIALFALAE